MNVHKKLDKVHILTHEADMLSRVLDDALKLHEDKDGVSEISYLSEIIRKKFDEIRDLF